MHLLPETHYRQLLEPLNRIPINTLFARSVIEQKIKGRVFADDPERPKTFYVVHPYGMSLLFGESNNETFNAWFRDYALNVKRERNRYEWMQAFPAGWNTVLDELFSGLLVRSADNTDNRAAGIVELNTRVNFKFREEHFTGNRKQDAHDHVTIVRTDGQIFRDMRGSVVPLYFWESEEDFLQNGVGFSLFYKDQLASTAYASFVHGNQLELGIETCAEFRGKGFAERTCAALIAYCIENNLEPVWACRLENTGSYKLAQKMGFVPSAEIPYYRLSN